MKKNKGMRTLVLAAVLLVIVIIVAAIGIGPTSTGSAKNIKLGLDLSGGVSITYQIEGDSYSTDDVSDTINKLKKRVESYSTEAQVYQEGDDRITVEIPDVTDANTILEDLGSPGSLEFQLEDGTVVLTGDDIADAQPASDSTSTASATDYVVDLTFTDEGATKFAEITADNLYSTLYIVYDDEIVSSPTIQTAITGGQANITGMSSYEEADSLASQIRIGSLTLTLTELQSKIVSAQIGADAIQTSLISAAIGIAIVMIFMIVVYLLPGVVSSLALAFYVAIMIIALNAFDITLTLPGIAGIILSIGMAVDANVIIFARVKEEIADGKTVGTAIKTGFKKAKSAIVDGNVTTLIAAFVLMLKGSGSVRGFAQTLALGIVLSMFTALFVTKKIMDAFYTIGFQDEKYFRAHKPRKVINFLSKKVIFIIISLAVIISGFISMGVYNSKGDNVLNFSLDFMGGTSTSVTFNEDYSIEEINDEIIPVVEEVTGDTNVLAQKVTNSDTYDITIKTRTLSLDERQELSDALVENFDVDPDTITDESISSTISGEMRQNAVIAVIIATICMLIYIWIRFNDLRFAASAVIALLHDVLVVLAFYAISRISVSSTFIACMLTIVGYSINATIVIFDRIREKLPFMSKGEELDDVVNESITQTLTRSIYTSFTTFVMIALLYVMGVDSVKEFAAPLMVGVVCGAYSSVCLTGAIWYIMKTKIVRKDK